MEIIMLLDELEDEIKNAKDAINSRNPCRC